MKHYISMYIDNELSLTEKIEFIQFTHEKEEFREEAISFLEQEKMLAATLNREAPADALQPPKIRLLPPLKQTVSLAAAACLLIMTAFLIGKNFSVSIPVNQEIASVRHRFVIYHTGSSKVEITGSFTDWQRIPMQPAGSKGYWELSLDLTPGDHRYSYILDNDDILPDPTVATREEDGFGSVNSILSVES